MQDIDLGPEDGRVTIRYGDFEKEVDLWEMDGILCEFHQKHKDDAPNDYNRGLVELMIEQGFPEVSYRVACRFVQKIQEAVHGVKKNSEATASSPGTTTSIPGS